MFSETYKTIAEDPFLEPSKKMQFYVDKFLSNQLGDSKAFKKQYNEILENKQWIES